MVGRASKTTTAITKVTASSKASGSKKRAKAKPRSDAPRNTQQNIKLPQKSFQKKLKAVDQLVSVAKKNQKTKRKKPTKAQLSIFSELQELSEYIQNAKTEIGLIRPNDVKEQLIPSAHDELDAVVEAAADATNVIMDSCEVVENIMGEVSPEVSEKLLDATTRIYEACTFQDITGQRINKVIKTMHHIEHRIDALMTTFDGVRVLDEPKNQPLVSQTQKGQDHSQIDNVDEIRDEDLLEGPQLSEKAKNQAEIDELLASFD